MEKKQNQENKMKKTEGRQDKNKIKEIQKIMARKKD